MSQQLVCIVCPCCGGPVTVALTNSAHWETLQKLRELGGEQTGAALARVMGCTPDAIYGRLRWLEGAGLATSRRHGRKRLYRATPDAKPTEPA